MSCHICSHPPVSRQPFLCPTCARSQLYQLRIENARIRLERESFGRQIGDKLASGNNQKKYDTSLERAKDLPEDEGSSFWAVQTIATEEAKSRARRQTVANQIERLNADIEHRRSDLSRRKSELERRKSDAGSAKYQLAGRETSALVGLQNNTKRTDHLWHALHSRTAEARIFLCREIASLYGLHHSAREKGGKLTSTYTISGVPIFDLRDLNGACPVQLSTSMSYIARLLVLTSHYLSLKLPAEIVLPHRNQPSTTIYAPSGSYLSQKSNFMPFPASSHSSPTTGAGKSHVHLPQSRPLSVDKSLPKLAVEDFRTYSLFLEGVTWLAWDLSWLCRTQGLNLASDSWEEVCDIGKNLWQLFLAPSVQTAALTRAFTGPDIQSSLKATKDAPRTTIQRTKSFPVLGHYSHGTVHSFLGASEGMDFMRTWKLSSPTAVMDKLKASLLGEMTNAEWEVLEKKEWDDTLHDLADTDPNPEQGHRLARDNSLTGSTAAEDRSRYNGAYLTTSTRVENNNRSKGTSGWTRLKNRS